jgi:hypothetical protein
VNIAFCVHYCNQIPSSIGSHLFVQSAAHSRKVLDLSQASVSFRLLLSQLLCGDLRAVEECRIAARCLPLGIGACLFSINGFVGCCHCPHLGGAWINLEHNQGFLGQISVIRLVCLSIS